MDNLQHLIDLGCSVTVIDRFWKHVCRSDSDSCWAWTGAKFASGYGKLEKGVRPYGGILAHRVSWIIHNGPIETSKHVCHRCDNALCCNPNHLWVGSMSENIYDKIRKGRSRWKHRLFGSDIETIRMLSKTMSQKEISSIFGIHQCHVSRIISKKRWNKIPAWAE